ncbi:eCIS core domain-containing protein [Kribbella endophytica]
MREHGFDAEEAALRPKGGRVEEQVSDQVGKAGAEGRTDVLGGAGMLGLQRAVGNSGVTAMVEEEKSPVHGVISSGGRALEPEVRGEMEGRLGHDFSDVRVHDDSAAHDSAKAVNAHAYTVGSNVVFQRDKYDPGSDAGKTMLAHELTHVVQQRSGPVEGTSAPGGIKVSDPSDRFEREASANAERVMAGPAPAVVAPGVQRVAAGDADVQRHEEDEAGVQRAEVGDAEVQREEEEKEEEVQGAFVQREEEEAQEEES